MFQKKKRKRSESTCGKHQIVIDLGFDDKMTDNEIISLAQQLVMGYGQNKKQEHPSIVYWTNFEGKLAQQNQKKNSGWQNWSHGLTISEKPYTELFEKTSLVYLTADSDTVLMDLREDEVYIVGGIVDHNRLKVFFSILVKCKFKKGFRRNILPF